MLRKAAIVGAVFMLVGNVLQYQLAGAETGIWRAGALGLIVLGAIILIASASTAVITAMAPKDTKDKT